MFTPKRQRTESNGGSGSGSGSGVGKNSSQKILSDMKSGHVEDGKSFKALCSCIIRAANENNEEDYECLEDLLQEGANPNYDEHSILEITGGSPLFLAIKLNVPRALEFLLQHGALLTQKYDHKTALEVRQNSLLLSPSPFLLSLLLGQLAFELGNQECLELIIEHIAHLESK
jgi:hypothetical protein